jgi:hypothetical protein
MPGLAPTARAAVIRPSTRDRLLYPEGSEAVVAPTSERELEGCGGVATVGSSSPDARGPGQWFQPLCSPSPGRPLVLPSRRTRRCEVGFTPIYRRPLSDHGNPSTSHGADRSSETDRVPSRASRQLVRSNAILTSSRTRPVRTALDLREPPLARFSLQHPEHRLSRFFRARSPRRRGD